MSAKPSSPFVTRLMATTSNVVNVTSVSVRGQIALWPLIKLLWLSLALISIALSASFGQGNAYVQTADTVLTPGEHYVTLNGLRFRYAVVGQGPVCLMPTPGWGPSYDAYLLAMKPLERYLTLVHLDTRGTGKSQRPPTPNDYTLTQFMDDLTALQTYLNQPKVWLMGHSQGGYLVMRYASLYPDRCRGLLVIDGTVGKDSVYEADFEKQLLKRQSEPWFKGAYKTGVDESRPISERLNLAMPFYFHDARTMPAAMTTLSKSSQSAQAYQGFKTSKMGDTFLLPTLNRITAPTLVLVGDDDFICPVESQAKRIRAAIPTADLVIIPEAGHFPFLEQRDRFFAKTEAWLSRQGLQPQD